MHTCMLILCKTTFWLPECLLSAISPQRWPKRRAFSKAHPLLSVLLTTNRVFPYPCICDPCSQQCLQELCPSWSSCQGIIQLQKSALDFQTTPLGLDWPPRFHLSCDPWGRGMASSGLGWGTPQPLHQQLADLQLQTQDFLRDSPHSQSHFWLVTSGICLLGTSLLHPCSSPPANTPWYRPSSCPALSQGLLPSIQATLFTHGSQSVVQGLLEGPQSPSQGSVRMRLFP